MADKPFGAFDDVQDRFHARILVETFSAAKRIVLAGQGVGGAIPFQIERELIQIERELKNKTVRGAAGRGRGFASTMASSPSAAAPSRPPQKAFMAIVRRIEQELSA